MTKIKLKLKSTAVSYQNPIRKQDKLREVMLFVY